MTRYWIGVASRDHVRKAVEGSFCQFSHGSAAVVKRLSPGDHLAYYSPRTGMRSGELIHAFTAIGVVLEGDPEVVRQAEGFRPSRRKVDYADGREAQIKPLLEELSFTRGQSHWGQTFRRGLFEIDRADFALIADAMGRG